jgi:hypothetical protein
VLHIAFLDRINNFTIRNCLSLGWPKTVGEGTVCEWRQAMRTKPPHWSDDLFVGVTYNFVQMDNDFLNSFLFCGDRTRTLIAQRTGSWKQRVVVFPHFMATRHLWNPSLITQRGREILTSSGIEKPGYNAWSSLLKRFAHMPICLHVVVRS